MTIARVLRWCAVMLGTTLLGQAALASDPLWATIGQGGHVILIRHAPVEQGADAGNPLTRDPTCRDERMLSDQGRSAARELGQRFADRRIPVSAVLHSPFCRTTETAQLAFGQSVPADYLSLLEILGPTEEARQTEELNRVIGSFSGGGNLVLVTHEPNIRAVSFEFIKHLDFLVLAPRGGSEFEELGVVRFLDDQ